MTQPQPQKKKQLLYLDKSTPEEFQKAELLDWIYLVGDISTQYELDFVRQFGYALRSRPLSIHTSSTEAPICERCKTDQEPFCIGCYRLKPHDTAIRNATLDDVVKEINKTLSVNWTPHRAGLKKARRAIESLRKQGGP